MQTENLDNSNLELLKSIEARTFEYKKDHNSSYFVFLWFLITIIWAFLWFKEELNIITKNTLFSSLLFILLGSYFYFQHNEILIGKYQKLYSIVWMHIDNNTHPREDLDKNMKESFKEKLLSKLSSYYQNIGVILFFISIILLVFFNK